MHIESAITTCDARKNRLAYLTETLKSLNEAGFNPLISTDGPVSKNPPGTRGILRRSGIRLGTVPTYRLTMLECLSLACDRFVVFQDDILAARGLREYLVDTAPSEGVVSLYTSYEYDSEEDGWKELDLTPTKKRPYPWLYSLGACGIMFDKKSAIALLKAPPPVRSDRLGAWIGEECHRQGIPFWIHSPSLVQHIGYDSVREGVPMTRERSARRFCTDAAEMSK